MALEDYIAPSWVSEGMKVWAPYDGRGKAIRCTVAIAAGKHARVHNDSRGFAKWFDIFDLRVPIDPEANRVFQET